MFIVVKDTQLNLMYNSWNDDFIKFLNNVDKIFYIDESLQNILKQRDKNCLPYQWNNLGQIYEVSIVDDAIVIGNPIGQALEVNYPYDQNGNFIGFTFKE